LPELKGLFEKARKDRLELKLEGRQEGVSEDAGSFDRAENTGEFTALVNKFYRAEEWKEIEKYVRERQSFGKYLMQKLQERGWEAVFWSPDVVKPADGKSEHASWYRNVINGKPYYGVNIDHLLINYRPSRGSSVTRDLSGIEKLKQVPFWVGIANGGYHCFLGYNDRLNESHSTLSPDNRKNIEDNPFMNWGTSTSPWYLSGVIMVPPGTWPAD